MCFLPLFFFRHSLPILGHVNWYVPEKQDQLQAQTHKGEKGGIFFKGLVHVVVKCKLECQAGNPGKS